MPLRERTISHLLPEIHAQDPGDSSGSRTRIDLRNFTRRGYSLPLIIFGLLLWPHPYARSQSPATSQIFVGPILEGSASLQVSDNPIPVYSLSPGCGTFDRTGSGSGFHFGVEGKFFPATWNGFGVSGRLTAEIGEGRFTAHPLDEQRIINTETNHPETIEREFRLDARSTTVALEPLASYRAGKRLNLAVGFRLGYRTKISFAQTDNVLGPGDRRFEDGQSAHPMTDGLRFVPGRWSLGPVLSSSCFFPLRNSLILAPGISLRADLLSPSDNISWKSYTLSAGFALLFDFSPTPPPPALPPDQPTPPPVPEIPPPRATVHIYGLDESGEPTEVTTIQASEVLYEQRLPLLPSIFFDRNSTEMPERYAIDPERSPESVRSESATDLLANTDWTLMMVNHHLPGVLAERMARNPDVVLEIAGSTSEDENGSDGEMRGERVKELLMRNGIPPHRVRTVPPRFKRSDERTTEGGEENRRVEIVTQDAALVGPVTTRQIVREFSPPAIRVKPDFEALAGVKEWEIAVLYNDSITARYTSEEKAEGKLPDFNWRITQRHGDTTLSPIVAMFSITDSLGRESTAYDTIQVVLEEQSAVVNRDVETAVDRERSNLWIIGFDYDSDMLSDRQRQEMEVIAGKIRAGAQITVTGYTDRIGTENYNILLSQRRAQTVAEALQELLARKGISEIAIEAVGGGVDQNLFDNNLPEGRRLSRSVVVSVEQRRGSR